MVRDSGDLIISQERGHLEVIPRQFQVIFRPLAAVGLCLAELAVAAGFELALALVCQLCCRGKHGLSPGQEFFPAHGVCADILPAGLVDGKADLSDIVDAIEQVEGAQRIAGKLAVLLRRHQDAKPVLVVNDVEEARPIR